jgi:hypothetical protein
LTVKLPSPEMLSQLNLTRLSPDQPAQAAVFSLPVPPGSGHVTAAGLPSQSVPIAWWPERLLADAEVGQRPELPQLSTYPQAGEPRRRLVTLAADGELPAEISLSQSPPAAADWPGPTWEQRILEHNYLTSINWEVNELVLRQGEREIGLRVGLMTDAEGPLWWEWLRVEELWSGPACQAIRASGYASAFRLTSEHPDVKDVRCPIWTHRQHWVFCEVYALLFANGVVHLTVRHVNNHLYDGGRDIEGVVPLIGLRGDFTGDLPLVGETVETSIGGVKLSTEECRTLASPQRPGRLWAEGELALLQPYEGVEIYLAGFGYGKEEQGYVVKADEHRIPTGVGRTVRCCLSFSEAPPRVERYVLPYFWYGLCAELTPDSLLPVSDFRDATLEAAGQWLEEAQLTGNFCDGSLPRGSSHTRGEQIIEAGWEGETPYNLIRHYYRRPAPGTWEACLRDAYQVADVVVDHATFNFRMHGYDFGAISPTMNRTLGVLQGYLETGDPYLRETAENVALNSFTMDTSNWPRRAYGRDAMYIRGLVALEDYLPGRGYGVRAREAIGRAIACRRPEGCYSDQAGPGGVHAAGNMVLKPWMNEMVMEPMLDWLERHPEDREVAETVHVICEWILAQFIREGEEAYWPYESGWGDNPGHPGSPGSTHPWNRFNLGYPARPMLLASRLFDDPRYLQAWEDNFHWLGGYDPQRATQIPRGGDHSANKFAECLTWHQMARWQARWVEGQVQVDPYCLPGERCEAMVYGPEGMVEVRAEGPSQQG